MKWLHIGKLYSVIKFSEVAKGYNLSLEELEKIIIAENMYESGYCNFEEVVARTLRVILDPIENVQATSRAMNVVLSNTKDLNVWPLGDEILNRRGLHVFRIIYSHMAHYIRQGKGIKERHNHLNMQSYIRDYNETGLVVIPDFALDVNIANEEIKKYAVSVNKQPWNNVLNNVPFNHACHRIVSSIDQIVRAVCPAPSGEVAWKDWYKKFTENTFFQNVYNDPAYSDEQYDAHSDIFFPAVKFWWFPEDVKLGQGPLVYKRGSAKLGYKNLDYFYGESISTSPTIPERSKVSHRQGSFRILPECLSPVLCDSIPVKANTLVIANVFGTHARAMALAPHNRYAIHGSIRIERPFDL